MVETRDVEESRARRAEARRREEAIALRAVWPASATVVALDEEGLALDSLEFATLLGSTRDMGANALVIVIGGPDGLDPNFRRGVGHVVAVGVMTWPHQLVRIMAAEQLYRAVTILSGHPYHRA